jgi:hypothetical protein
MPASKKAKLKHGALLKRNFTEEDYYANPGDVLVVPAIDGYAPKMGKGEDGVEIMQLISDETIGILDHKGDRQGFRDNDSSGFPSRLFSIIFLQLQCATRFQPEKTSVSRCLPQVLQLEKNQPDVDINNNMWYTVPR